MQDVADGTIRAALAQVALGVSRGPAASSRTMMNRETASQAEGKDQPEYHVQGLATCAWLTRSASVTAVDVFPDGCQRQPVARVRCVSP